MGAAFTFLGPFLEYLRPAKSPYLIVALVCTFAIYEALGSKSDFDLYRPDFFLIPYIVLVIVVPLSLTTRRYGVKASTEPTNNTNAIDVSAAPAIDNSKFENDIESVFKFSRAACLVAGIMMVYYYFNHKHSWGYFSLAGYIIIILQIVTFLIFFVLRQLFGEDISNLNLFQIAFMTVIVFCGATFCALNVKAASIEPFYACIQYEIIRVGNQEPLTSSCYSETTSADAPESTSNDYKNLRASNIDMIEADFRPDFRQISFYLFAICWLVYEIFWLKILLEIVRGRQNPS